jgi:glutamate formiminotransferase / formiminotetrahydrofolate cyclodeaminase
MKKIIECIPNFSEGNNLETIQKIANAISETKDVSLLNIDIGKATNRTVMTFIGEMDAVLQAMYNAYEIAVNEIDMSVHKGTHPRMGAVDVCPFVALDTSNEAELIEKVDIFAAKVAHNLKVPIYLYEKSAKSADRKYLANIRKGEYQGFEEKMKTEAWKPDFGASWNPKTGASAVGVRDLLIAFNVNIKGGTLKIAKEIAGKLRETGYLEKDAAGNKTRISGLHKGLRAIGWYIDEFDKIQISMNITDIKSSPLHLIFESCQNLAIAYNIEVSGSELIGLIPKKSMIEAGYYFNTSCKNDIEALESAKNALNLNEVKRFDLTEHILDIEKIMSL